MNLRPYQQESKDQIRALFKQGHRKVILCQPTGAGKTVTFASMASDTVKNGYKVAIIVNRRELLTQASDKLRAYGLIANVIKRRNYNRNAMAYVTTVQTLAKMDPVEGVSLFVIDEAHIQIFDKILDLPQYKNMWVIGATATPIRTGRMKQLSDHYTAIVEPVTITQLIADGHLVPAITYAAKDGGADLSKVKTKMGDYDKKGMFDAFNKPKLYDGVVEKYKMFADGDRAICFNINVEHSIKTAKAFNDQGIKAKHCDGSMTQAVRAIILEEWRLGLFDVLCNCDLFTTGFDEPSIETVIINRSTQSLPLYFQMCGRGSRLFKGKSHFNILDMGANVYRFGFWEQEIKFNLTHETKKHKGDAPVKECNPIVEDKNGQYGCGAIVPASATECKYCNFIFPKKPRKLVVGDFGQVTDKSKPLPKYLALKNFTEMSIDELEEVRKLRRYNIGWLVRQVAFRKDLTLEDLQRYKGYDWRWVARTKERLGIED